MNKLLRLTFIAVFVTVFVFTPSSKVQANGLPENCEIIPYPLPPATPATLYLLCHATSEWNGDVVVYAHGYVSPTVTAPYMPYEQLAIGGTPVPLLVNQYGYDFIAASYPVNGLAVKPGIQDLINLVNYYKAYKTSLELTVDHVFLVGVSEGALITTLALEKYPENFSGGMALCGPIGDFRKQVNYFGDMRVVFDYFFKKLLPKNAVTIPSILINNWETWADPDPAQDPYLTRVIDAVSANPEKAGLLLHALNAPIDEANPTETTVLTITDVLWYNVFATNDAKLKLGGQPFDNRSPRRVYSTGNNLIDKDLNLKVARYTAGSKAVKELKANYQTTGNLTIPLITMHTTGDPVIPYWHETLYTAKTLLNGGALNHLNIPVERYGHCNFTADEVMGGFSALAAWVGGLPPGQ